MKQTRFCKSTIVGGGGVGAGSSYVGLKMVNLNLSIWKRYFH
jgi:hypothetical protein